MIIGTIRLVLQYFNRTTLEILKPKGIQAFFKNQESPRIFENHQGIQGDHSPQRIKKIDQDTVLSSPKISLLGLEYNSNFSTTPYLCQLAREANTRAAVIRRLSFGMPNYPLKPLANGLLMGKILAATPAAVPIKPYLTGILNDIDKSIRSTAKTIPRIKLTNKVKYEILLWKAGLLSLTEAVIISIATTIWKSRKDMKP